MHFIYKSTYHEIHINYQLTVRSLNIYTPYGMIYKYIHTIQYNLKKYTTYNKIYKYIHTIQQDLNKYTPYIKIQIYAHHTLRSKYIHTKQ